MLILLQCLWSVISTHHPDIDLLCQALQALAISRTPFLLGAQGEVIWLPENNMHSSCSHPFRLCHQTIWFLKDKEVSLFFFFPPPWLSACSTLLKGRMRSAERIYKSLAHKRTHLHSQKGSGSPDGYLFGQVQCCPHRENGYRADRFERKLINYCKQISLPLRRDFLCKQTAIWHVYISPQAMCCAFSVKLKKIKTIS